MSASEQIARILLGRKSVALDVSEPFIYASGIKSPIYCDNRLLISYPTERDLVVDAFIALFEEKGIEFDVVAGTATAGIPWAAFIAQKMGKPLVYIKKEAKGYGTKKLIEGSLQEGQKVVVIEDLISTGGSSIKAAECVKESGGAVSAVVAIFTYEMKKAQEAFDASGFVLHTLSNISTLVDVAVKDNHIKEDEKDIVLSWNKDPENWGK